LQQARAINRLTGMPEWALLMDLCENRLLEAHRDLETVDEKYFRSKQGKVSEIRFMLGLEETVKAVLNRDRTPSSTPGYEM
jgi:hypothetical protein